ncbi:hypothetical protein [Aquimarina sp. MMG016]|uniref:hypothetical protein n=1 Tax=Aquimarina sp. MMG016 TaxID=2822690 RepID=UPI001B3A2A10|nr:hypothetical protein [Aquimarina sp. MMG016]MBQ4822068.1 hypothetical protein [Aquimarina sp. MMG016]
MDIHQIKLELIKRILDCTDINILNQIENILENHNSDLVMEPEEAYKMKSIDLIPESHYLLLEEDRKRHLNGETKGSSWDEVEKRLREKYDL